MHVKPFTFFNWCTGKPENIILSSDDTALNIKWDEPEAGETNEQVQTYDIECFFTQEDNNYSLKQSVNSDTTEASLPVTNAVSASSMYNCCVEAAFETYSSKDCVKQPSMTTSVSTNTQQIQESGCPSDTIVQTVAGVLTTIIIVLLILLVAVSCSLVYTCKTVKKIKEIHTPGPK